MQHAKKGPLPTSKPTPAPKDDAGSKSKLKQASFEQGNAALAPPQGKPGGPVIGAHKQPGPAPVVHGAQALGPQAAPGLKPGGPVIGAHKLPALPQTPVVPASGAQAAPGPKPGGPLIGAHKLPALPQAPVVHGAQAMGAQAAPGLKPGGPVIGAHKLPALPQTPALPGPQAAQGGPVIGAHKLPALPQTPAPSLGGAAKQGARPEPLAPQQAVPMMPALPTTPAPTLTPAPKVGANVGQPLGAPPVAAPVMAPPVVAAPVMAAPVVAPPVVAPGGQAALEAEDAAALHVIDNEVDVFKDEAATATYFNARVPAQFAGAQPDHAKTTRDCLARGITLPELHALVGYTGPAYVPMNRLKRGQMKSARFTNLFKPYCDAAQRAMKKAEKHKGDTQRGWREIPGGNDGLIENLYHRDFVDEAGFLSTTVNTGKSMFDGPVSLQITGQSGVDLDRLSVYPSEGEVLYPPGTHFAVDGFVRNADVEAAWKKWHQDKSNAKPIKPWFEVNLREV